MPTLVRCKEQLYHLYQQQPVLQQRFSDFTRLAWGADKASCLEQFGSVADVQRFLLNPGEIWVQEHGVATENSWAVQSQTTQVPTGWRLEGLQAGIPTNIRAHAVTIGRWLLVIVIGICLRKVVSYLLVGMYDVLNTHRIQYVKVILPRSDSKSDREREKEVAKDMKEKIGRMSQVYTSLHKMGNLSFMDNIMRWLFDKPKMSFIMHYEDGLLSFIVGVYPEYRKIVESAIGAQYPETSIEAIPTPDLYKNKFVDIMPMQPVKSPYYPIRIFKQLEDDPLNNIIDSLGKVPPEDTFSVVLTLRPEKKWFNKGAQRLANALFKKDETITNPVPLRKKLLPRNFFSFMINGPSQKLVEKFTSGGKQGDPLVRMVKAEEEAYNTMAEEAGKPAFDGGLMLISTSDREGRATENIYNIVSAYSIYTDEYNNALDQPETIADLLGPLVKPLWKLSITFLLPWFMYKKNVFTVGELASLFHLPDGTYNRSQIIKRMDYKVLPGPDTLPIPQEPNGYVISGVIAESYKWGNLDKILEHMKHPSVTTKEVEEDHKQEVSADYIPKAWEEMIQEGDKNYVVTKIKKKITGLKVYKDAILLGLNVYRNKFTPVYMKKKDRTRHQYIIWKSGTGKSVFIDMMARQDIRNGDGVCVIDPHGDLVESILEYVPKERARDIVYFDAGDEARPMWLNLYEIHHPSEADRAVNDATEMFIKMFGPEIFWPRIQEYFKFGSMTLLEDLEEPATLIDVPRLFTDEVYREYKVKKVKNPVTRNFREKTFNAMGDREKQEIIPYFTAKFVSFTTNSLIRNIIGQTKSAFDFQEIMDNRKILLINLSKGKLWELNSQLLGMILVSKIYNGAMARARMAEKDRKYFFLYVDEFQNFITDTFADILSEARKYKLGLVMAHQFIAQLESNTGNNIWEGKSKVKDAVFGNVGTMMSFKVGAPDAEFLEKEYAPVLGGQDIIGIANYKAYIKLNIDNTTSRVFSMNSIWTQDYQNPKMADVLKEYCSKKYGRKKEFVDAEIAARLGMLQEGGGEAMWGDAENTKTSTDEGVDSSTPADSLDTPSDDQSV